MPITERNARRLAAARDILAVLAFCAAVGFGWRAFVNSPFLQKERVTRREAAADIEAFFSQARRTHPGPALSEDRFELLKSSALAAADAGLDEFQRVKVRDLTLILYRSAAAFGDSGTTALWRPPHRHRDQDLKFPPFSLEYRGDRLVIWRAADPALVGAEPLEVNGAGFAGYIGQALELVSAETPRLRAWLFCRDQAFWWDFAALVPPDKPLALKVRTPSGRTLSRTLAPVPAAEFRRLAARHTPLPRMIYSQSRLAWLRVEDLTASRAARREWARFFDEARQKGASTLVLDLSEAAGGDPGGENYLSGYFGGWLKGPMRPFEGKIYLVIGPGTGPAAAALAARFRALKAGKILGAETGGTAAWCGAPREFTLPGSGLKYSVSSVCYPGIPAGTIAPDTAITPEKLRPHGDLKAYILSLDQVPAVK